MVINPAAYYRRSCVDDRL